MLQSVPFTLSQATKHKKEETMKNSQSNTKDKNGATPLHLAAYNNVPAALAYSLGLLAVRAPGESGCAGARREMICGKRQGSRQ